MRIGTLRDLVTLQLPITARDARGGQTDPVWHPFASEWAAVEQQFGRERIVSGAVSQVPTHRLTMRHRTDITPQLRVVYQGSAYEIAAVREIGRRWLELDLVEVR